MNKPTSLPLPDYTYRKAHGGGSERCIGGAQPCDALPRGLQVSVRIARCAFLTGLMNAKAKALLVVCHRVNLSKPVTLRAADSGVQNAWRNLAISTRDGHHTCSNEFSESIKKDLMFYIMPVYGYIAPAKSGAGIGVLNDCMAIHDAPSVFFCVVKPTYPFFGAAVIIRAAHKIMVGWVGASSEAPESIQSGYANLAQSTTSEIGVSCGGLLGHCMEDATWLLPLPKIRNLYGLSPLFAAICRQLKLKSITLPHILSAKPVALWFGITSAFSLVASVWRWLMRNYFRITGYAVNKRGLTVGIGYQLTSSDTKTAMAHAVLQAQREGLCHVRITRVQEVAA